MRQQNFLFCGVYSTSFISDSESPSTPAAGSVFDKEYVKHDKGV